MFMEFRLCTTTPRARWGKRARSLNRDPNCSNCWCWFRRERAVSVSEYYNKNKDLVVIPTGIEPVTYRLGICRSILLSYGTSRADT